MAETRRRVVRAAVFLVIAAGGGVFLACLPAAWSFARHAPSAFWAITGLAVIADASVPAVLRRTRQANRTTLSACLAFAIFLMWGSEPAIVIQGVAAAIAAGARRLTPARGGLLAGRLVLALGAAELTVVLHQDRPITEVGSGLTGGEVLAVLPPVLAWFVVSYGLVVLAQLMVGVHSVRAIAGSIREDMFGTAATMLLVSPLLTTMTGWWSAVLIVPLLAWNQLTRERATQERRASFEPVTGVLNRQGLVAGIESFTAGDLLDPDNPRRLSVLLVNVEAIMAVNRMLGRDLYERLVAEVAVRLAGLVGSERVGRLAGEGFVILLPDLDEASTVGRAEEVVAALRPPIEVNGIPFEAEPAVGIALSPRHGRDFGTLVGKAEAAVAIARHLGRCTQVYVPEAATVVRGRVALLAELHDVLRDPGRWDEIAVLYQPQVDLRTGALAGVEALMRWTHPEWGPVPTEDLIRAIEPSAVMHLLTAHILGRVARQARAWNEVGLRVRVAVNVSVRDLYDDGFAELIHATVRGHGLHPSQLTIEITEGMLITNAARVGAAARGLAALGVGLSLDDFGTGFASLHQLRLLPLTEVKIDRSYVAAMTTDPAQRAIVVSVHELARALGLAVVAEGVEDLTTVRALADLPGSIGQGYFFSRAVPAAEIPGLLEGWRRGAAGGWGRRRRVFTRAGRVSDSGLANRPW